MLQNKIEILTQHFQCFNKWTKFHNVSKNSSLNFGGNIRTEKANTKNLSQTFNTYFVNTSIFSGGKINTVCRKC